MIPLSLTYVFPFAVSLTKTEKKVHERKSDLVKQIRDALEEYNSVYLFGYENMRNNKLKDVRAEWRDSRFVQFHFLDLLVC